MSGFEQGPIRPPSEARSLLVRVNRGCPWNRCAFCPVYKGARFSRRSVAEILADLDAMRALYRDAPRTVFLQDADPLAMRPDDLVAVLEGIRERFPRVHRVTAYARFHTLARRSAEVLARLREAGLTRIHAGLESGDDTVLDLVRKGTTHREQVEAGRRVVASGLELSLYVMPGLGGREHSAAHARNSARALAAIQPRYTRLRTTAVVPGTPLATLVDEGTLTPLTEVETVREIRALLTHAIELAPPLRTSLRSDHVLNLLTELRGELPRDGDALRARCDAFLDLSAAERTRFVVGRRLWPGAPLEAVAEEAADEVDRAIEQARAEGVDPDDLAARLRRRWI